LGGYSIYREHQLLTQSVVEKKLSEIALISTYIQSRINELKNDVELLSLTPPITGIIRAERNNGYDPVERSTTKQWKDRLATIFASMQRSKKHYTQIRYVGIDNSGDEIVRVDQRRSGVHRTPDQDLQNKRHEPYFEKIISLPDREVFFSEFSANRERGKVVLPIQMVLRVAVPIFYQNDTPFGFVVINVDYEEIFSDLKSFVTKESDYFIANQAGEILYHSDRRIRTGGGIPTLAMFKKNMSDMKKVFSMEKNKIIAKSYVGEKEVIVAKKFLFNGENQKDFLRIFLNTDKSVAMSKANEGIVRDLVIILILILLSIVMASYFSGFISKPIKSLTHYAESLGEKDIGKYVKPSITSKDEIGALADKLEKMSTEIDAKSLALTHQKEALDHSAVVVQADVDGVITYVNEKFLEISKYPKVEILGREFHGFSTDFHSEDFFKALWREISSGRVWKGEMCNKAKDGSLFWMNTSIYPVIVNDQIEKYIAIKFDITDRKKAEEKLIKATDEIRKAAENKSEFLTNMSHEIRTPINGIIGFTDLLLGERLTNNQMKHVDFIKDCSDHLLSIINDFLDYTKIESGKITLEKQSFHIREALDSLPVLAGHMAVQNNVKIHITIPEDMPQSLASDLTRLKQILINLTTNAVKFTKDGDVWISVSARPIKDGMFEYQFSIKDTGIGISEVGIEKLFSAFTQADTSTTRKFGGTGLGLTISRRLTDLLGGKIWVESELGKGSTFYFTIVAKAVDTKSESHEKPKQVGIDGNAGLLRPLRILVAEDNKVNQKLILGFLAKLNYQADLVENGLLAVEAVSTGEYDVVLMDIQMPKMDGLEASKRIKEAAQEEARPLIIALTANAMPEDQERCKAAGMFDYIIKPVLLPLLAESLEKAYHFLESRKPKNKDVA